MKAPPASVLAECELRSSTKDSSMHKSTFSLPSSHIVHRKWNLLGSLSRNKLFVIQALGIWIGLCLPGNIVTGILFYQINYGTPKDLEPPLTESGSLKIEEILSLEDESQDLRPIQAVCHHLLTICEPTNDVQLSECEDKLVKDYLDPHLQVTMNGLANNITRNDTLEELYSQLLNYLPESFQECLTQIFDGRQDSADLLDCHEDKAVYGHWVAQSTFWVEGVAVTVVGTFGLIGNILTMLIFRQIKINKNFNNLLIILSFCDFLLILDVMGEMSIIGVFMGKEPMWFKVLYPWIIHPLRGFIQTTSMYMVVAVSTERFQAVCYPLAPRHSFIKLVIVAILISFGIEFPRFLEFELVHNQTDYWTTKIMEDPDYIQFNSYWNDLFATGLFPLICLVYMNFKIYRNIRASSRFHKRFSVRTTHREHAVRNSYQSFRMEVRVPDKEQQVTTTLKIDHPKQHSVRLREREPTSETSFVSKMSFRKENSSKNSDPDVIEHQGRAS
ncbi:hypothetical protein TCAL_13459 [Tigriopus californicus]|uniref:G-protein coupled receptors family 1 profile domain-containing protein n=1 Tax=Tigriopus californicus TaxID=6832 RepID=A0A553PG14_TIGCA|nr:uncharacterized protein LOC131880991 [Tigriopus californicus]TRY76614.1 hypothetical protein TCAL_13459 [Tigriopus californicus]|eukprot:TCALIF_13459-PA protein Name:"Similar to FR FMRFamide receptor (Drosophila melanogaster)" AED:0.25 eAED:0.26 QI:0/-1/0/1/-1/1/1/0/500